jgi:hypothetical protein
MCFITKLRKQYIKKLNITKKNNFERSTKSLFFDRLFEIAPYLRDLFPFGYNPDSPDLKTHALGVMNTVGVAVKGLDDFEKLRPQLVELGNLHKTFELTDKEFRVSI